MTFSGFHHVLIDATLGHIPHLSGSFGRGWFVQTVLIEDMSHCYDIFGLHHVSIGCHTRAYPSNFAFTIFRSDVQTSSSTYQAFRLRLHMDKTFRLHFLHIRRSDFAFIWIRCSDFIYITFASSSGQAFRLRLHMDQTFRLRFLHIRHSDFAFVRALPPGPLRRGVVPLTGYRGMSHALFFRLRESSNPRPQGHIEVGSTLTTN